MIVESGGLAAISVAGLGYTSLFLQATAPLVGTDPSVLDQIGRLGVQGLLATAVVVLWMKVQEKDKLLMDNYKNLADTMASNKNTMEKMADTLEGIKTEVERLHTVRDQLISAKH